MRPLLQPECLDRCAVRSAMACILVVVLTACGGGQDSGNLSSQQPAAPPTAPRSTAATEAATAPGASTIALQEAGARLNTEELASIAQTGVLPTPFVGSLLSGANRADAKSFDAAPKSAAARVPVYRFYNASTGAHFFTTSTSERDHILATLPTFNYEGPAFYTSSIAVPGLSPVHRFYNSATGVHFYTISESERAHIAATLPTFRYEGVAYHASALPGPGYTPLYRFFYAARGFHFYTNSVAERDRIIATLPQYRYENVGYYVLGSDWQTPAVPHTGITSAQCYQAGSDSLVACASAGALALSRQQDGHRAEINPMDYSLVSLGGGGLITLVYPATSCVKDNITGLVWEGKEATGTRAGGNNHTNHGDGRTGDASAYVTAVNAMALCGFTDWRLPTIEELLGLVHLGEASGSRISNTWFPNTFFGGYWASNAYAADISLAWNASFARIGAGGPQPNAGVIGRSFAMGVRLVRGAPWTGQRYLFTDAYYRAPIASIFPADSNGNVAVDRRTGLSWRRCLEGQLWLGTVCLGTPTAFTHQAALLHAQSQAGWRLPNAKELATLVDYARGSPTIDPAAFPGAGAEAYWSSSPRALSADTAFFVWLTSGYSGSASRTNNYPIRLLAAD